jgi:hypothetical protein
LRETAIAREAAKVRRACAGCATASTTPCRRCAGERGVQEGTATGSAREGEAPDLVHEVLRAPGRPLDEGLRQDFERRLGHDFSRVRVHADRQGADSARAVGALAYTVGQHVVLGPGAALSDRRLLAHELTHVIQQGAAPPLGPAGNVRPALASPAVQGYGGRLRVGSPDDVLEQEAERVASTEGTAVAGPTGGAPLQIQRTCGEELGPPQPDCTPSRQGVVGWQFRFRVDCDELLPGEEANFARLRHRSRLNIHGFASQDGTEAYNDSLSCHRANRIAALARARRPDCPVAGRFKHGEHEARRDPNPPDFWRSVIVEELPRDPQLWLDPAAILAQARSLLAQARGTPSPANLAAAAAHRARIRTWLESIPNTVAPPGSELDRQDLTDYRAFQASAERLWTEIDQLLAQQGHSAATTDTFTGWASGSGSDQGTRLHAQSIPTGARYHIDIFGEGYFPGAINIGMATRTTTTRVQGTRVPNLIYREFTHSVAANRLPLADHVADLVTLENGPLMMPGLISEMARIVAPGGTIVLYGPDGMERYHDQVARAVGGTITKTFRDGALESRIVVPSR